MRFYISLFLMFIVSIFIVQNTDVIDIKFLIWTASISSALLLFLLLAFGIIIGWLFRSMTIWKKKKTEKSSIAEK